MKSKIKKTRTSDTSDGPNDYFDNLIRLIPGYDPFFSAGECRFDYDEAAEAIGFIEDCCTHIEGEKSGQKFILENWERSIVANIFGWKHKDEFGREVRRYREVFVYVPRKNGKTPLVAAIALYVYFMDNEKGQQDYCAAGEKDQAGLVYRHMVGMIGNEPSMSSRCKIYRASKTITSETEGSFIRVLSADADTKHGGNSHLIIIDELHIQPNRDLVDTLITSTASANRKQPLVIYITTADYDRESICNEKYKYACGVRDYDGKGAGFNDPAFLPVIYEATNKDDWTSPETWRKANPNLGVSVSEDYLTRECKRAQETPTYENTFKRLHLNIRTQNDVKWIPLEKWDLCDGQEIDLAGRECYCGLDLSSTTDITAFVMIFPLDEGYAVLPKFWIPEENARQRERKDKVPYETWGRQGLIELTPGNVVDQSYIRKRISELNQTYQLKQLAIDRWNAGKITTELQEDGFDVVMFGQGFGSMNAPSKELEKLIIGRQLSHFGNPVLRWMAGNAAAETDAAGNVKPSKKKSTERIDGIVGLVMALGLAIQNKEEGPSVYEERGIMTL